MNLNEGQERPRSSPRRQSVTEDDLQIPDLEEAQSASDSEWVSPFTVLPPLPKLRKSRQLLRSPEERLHQRNNSSAYYAAAWGSPYATPSPNRSPTRKDHVTRDLNSPLSAKHARFQSIAAPSDSATGFGRNKDFLAASSRVRSRSWDRLESQLEGRHWLSESEASGSEPDEKIGKTPTRKIPNNGITGSASTTGKGHQVQESASTITPDTFHGSDIPKLVSTVTRTMEQAAVDGLDARSGSSPVDKPLPELPLQGSVQGNPTALDEAPEPLPRPNMSSTQSFRKDKKKVLWKGKTCVIAFPLSDREADGLPPLLTALEVKERLQAWVDQGYDIDGVRVSDGYSPSLSTSSQSRSLYPDPAEMFAERKNGQLHVHIPDQSEWDAWVEYLKEEKLRALGVTPSNSEAPQSTQSPFSSTLSRVSSAFPSLAPSPPMSAMSNGANQIRIASNTFSPPISHPSQAGSHMASPLGGMQGPMHGYKGSLAFPRMTSPFEYPVSQPNIFNQGMRQTPNGTGQRQFSPTNMVTVPSMGQILSPIIPSAPTVPSNDSGRGTSQNASMEQIRQQQQRQQQIHAQMLQQQHQRQQSLFPQPPKSADLPRTPNALASPTRSTPEIMHPTPRSHRHNLSATLQKGVDDAEAARSTESSALLSERLQNVQNHGAAKPDVVVEEEDVEDQEHEELPVLKRPETLSNTNDGSDIETNPSMSASPLLMDEENPFANMSTLKDVLQTQTPQKQTVNHKPTASLSRFNVDAPTFSPSKAPSTAGFSFNPVTASAFVPVHSNNPSLSRLAHTSKAPSLSRFNVEAPTFTPSFMKQTTPQDSVVSTPAKSSTPAREAPSSKKTPAEKPVFTFSSPFNVEAPEFKPTAQAFSFNAPEFVPGQSISFSEQKMTPIFQAHHASAGSIFGDVTIDPLAKVNRRGAKALPIIAPKSRENTPVEITDVDEEGRLREPTDRQKRARRVDDDGDQAPQFAESAPFDHAEGLAVNDRSSRESTPRKESMTREKAVQLETTLTDEKASDGHLQSKSLVEADFAQLESSPVAKRAAEGNIEPLSNGIESAASQRLIDLEPSKPESESFGEDNLDDVVEVEEELSSEPDESQQIVESGENAKSSLSALAEAFEPIPAAPPQPKKTGLGASRFAASPPPKLSSGLKASRFAQSPEASPPLAANPQTTRINNDALPPSELYEYVNPRDIDLAPTTASQYNAYEGVTPKLPNMQFENTPELMKSIEDSMRSEKNGDQTASQSESSKVDQPSFEEIDAVMKQFENDPDLGVERDETPVKSTPLIDMRLPPNMRSDAPSPSPKRLQEGFQRASPQRRADYGLGIHKLNDSTGAISDWGNDYSPQQEHKLHQRAGFFDGHVNGVVDGIIENRLEPLERSLQTIQHSIALLATQPTQRSRRSLSTDNRESDADDEDDFDDMEKHSQSFRSRSPSRRDKKTDKIRNAVIDAMSAYQPATEQPVIDMTEIRAALEEMRTLSHKVQQSQPQPDFKSMIEEAISSHPRFRVPPVNDDAEAQQEAFILKMEVLEKSLKEAEERAEQETKLRQQSEADMQTLNQKLLDARDVANQQREAHEAVQHRHAALQKEQDASRAREATLSEVEGKLAKAEEKNVKLEVLADEYRRSVEDLRDQVSDERSRYQDLEFTLHVIKAKHDERDESRQALRNQIERLQQRIAEVMDDMGQEDTEWRKREHELVIANQKTQAALDHEVRHRQKVEAERDQMELGYRESQQLKSTHEVNQREMDRLGAQIVQLREENKAYQDKAFQLERELTHAQSVTTSEVTKATAQLQSELDAARWTVDNLKSDSEAQIDRLQSRMDNAELDLEDQKAKHDSTINDMTEAHNQALHEAQEKRENALQEQHTTHERKLNDLRDRHTRALHNSSDDRHRLEFHLNEKLTFSEDKVKHLEGKVTDLEERLEVTKAAARAAVEAASAKGINLPTPAPSVVASPPQRATSASMLLSKVSDLPERISPQALRESIMVLQDQLQNRETKIEELQQELAATDKEAPTKVKERENEITMLRELLAVRADDLAELITILTKSDFSRERARDAAIRLRANTQMEQQLKERAHAIGQMSMPSISSITNLASSPRALPMAAAAAWGNWRKARDFSTNALSSLANPAGEQTPSKSNSSSPSSILAGMMTPPNTSQRTPPSARSDGQSSPTSRPLAAAAAAARKKSVLMSAPRPLRGYSAQPRSLATQQTDIGAGGDDHTRSGIRSDEDVDVVSPQTPTFSRGIGSNSQNLEFGDDIDDDASPFDSNASESVDISPETEESSIAKEPTSAEA